MKTMTSGKGENSIVTTEASSNCGISKDMVKGGDISPYYEQFRGDVIAAVPSEAKCVLSVGCAGGISEAELVKKGIKVVGVEINREAAKIARRRGLTILEGDASEVDVSVTGEVYDCIIYADVLEHLPDPVAVLKRHVKHLRSGGTVYISIPNFRHYSVFWELFVRGQVRYKDAGILDRTHLRITTRKTVLEWLEKVGLELTTFHYGIPGRRNRVFSACLFGLAREFIATQIGLVARKADVCPSFSQ